MVWWFYEPEDTKKRTRTLWEFYSVYSNSCKQRTSKTWIFKTEWINRIWMQGNAVQKISHFIWIKFSSCLFTFLCSAILIKFETDSFDNVAHATMRTYPPNRKLCAISEATLKFMKWTFFTTFAYLLFFLFFRVCL